MDFSFIITGFLNLLFAPYYYPEMFWVVFPLIITLFVIEFYSGLYENEDYGGHTSLTNSLVFVYIGVDLIRKLNTIIKGIISHTINLIHTIFSHF